MTLTARLSLFFLSMLGVVLVGFSLSLFWLARTYLYQQAEERLQAVTNTLAAAIEVAPDGVEWEPTERPPAPMPGTLGEPMVWFVTDDRGQLIARSSAAAESPPLPSTEETFDQLSGPHLLQGQGGPWQWTQRWIKPTTAGKLPSAPAQDKDKKYAALRIVVAMSVAPVQATLGRLGAALAIISAAIGLAGLALSRAVCRRALQPVQQMSAAARTMDTSDISRRLPVPTKGDELADLGQAFNDLLSRLQESLQRQRRFTGDASHQLRTPLTAVLGQIEVALRHPRSSEEYETLLHLIHRQGLQLRHIVEMLLFLARAEAEARLPALETIDLTSWLSNHLHSWSAHPRAADLHVEATGAAVRVKAQAPLLAHLVDNLVDNATKYTTPGTPIFIQLRAEPSRAFLIVRDSGPGIPPADLPHVFEPFYRSADARRRGIAGVGLGLSIAQRIARAFDGELHVQSEPGRGTTVTISLPHLDQPPAETSDGSGSVAREQLSGPPASVNPMSVHGGLLRPGHEANTIT